MNPTIEELTVAVEREARKRPEALRLMTHPGVGPLTALAQRGKRIGAYVGRSRVKTPVLARSA